MIKVLQIGDPILEEKSGAIQDPTSKEIQALVDDLLSVCRGKENSTAGLSAPQIGQNKRVFIARRIDIEEKYEKLQKPLPKKMKSQMWEVLINPEIIKLGDTMSTFWEGCLSIKGIFGPVSRPGFVKMKYLDRDGKPREISGSGYFGHVLLHELDHLEGILFLKYVKNPENLWKNKDLDDYIERYGRMPDVV